MDKVEHLMDKILVTPLLNRPYVNQANGTFQPKQSLPCEIKKDSATPRVLVVLRK